MPILEHEMPDVNTQHVRAGDDVESRVIQAILNLSVMLAGSVSADISRRCDHLRREWRPVTAQVPARQRLLALLDIIQRSKRKALLFTQAPMHPTHKLSDFPVIS